VPSWRKNLTPRTQPMQRITGKAQAERIIACSIGGMSGSASLIAIWLKPQLKHSMSISATASGVSGRPADDGAP
jgi:hypothetical protein